MSSTAEEFAGGVGFVYHVPQHSRREKLRFPADETGTSSVGLLYQSNGGFHDQLPSAAYNNQNMEECGAQQIPAQGFSLSLSPATVGPLGPFTGYAAVLNRSGFVEPARQLLEEICRHLLGRGGGGGGVELGGRDLTEDHMMSTEDITMETLRPALHDEEHDLYYSNKLKLVSMLDQVYRRYRLYYQQVETVITSFETVAGLNTAAPYVSLALKSMSKNFKSLKNLISNHLNNLDKVNGKEGLVGKGEFTTAGFSLTAATGDHTCSQRRNSSFTFGQPQVWRPQRGLPERAVAVLKAWLFEHFLHPYPTDTDKQMLAKQTGLTRNQVSNWFINARVRLWKPMVEEIHNLELHQKLQQEETLIMRSAADHRHNNNVKKNSTTFDQPSAAATISSASNRSPAPAVENINFMMQRNSNKLDHQQHRSNYNYPRAANSNMIGEQLLLPRAHDDHINIEESSYKFVFDDHHFASHHHHPVVGSSTTGVEIGANSSTVVSLTLGLPDQPTSLSAINLNVARRFGLEECSNAAAAAYVLAGFEGAGQPQDRHHHHYGAKEIINAAHLLHDFVG